MPQLEFKAEVVHLVHENGSRLAVPLFFPDISVLDTHRDRIAGEIKRQITNSLEKLPLHEIYRRQSSETPKKEAVSLKVQPPTDRRADWREPVRMQFHYVYWSHGESVILAYVPALHLEVIAQGNVKIEDRVRQEISLALKRRKKNTSLRNLLWLQQCKSVQIETLTFDIDIETAKQREQRGHSDKGPTALQQVATDLEKVSYAPVFRREELVKAIAEWLVGRRPRSILLVGPSGVGKTALVHELHRCRSSLGLAETPVWTTSGARMVAGKSGFGMWQESVQQVCREVSEANGILHLGNLMELTQVGRSIHNDQGIGQFLRPFIERGELLAITECTPEQRSVIERESPSLLHAFVVVEVDEPTVEDARAILEQFHPTAADEHNVLLTDAAVATVDRLHRRYATYSAYPGRPLRFLANLYRDAEPHTELTSKDVTQAFCLETGLPTVLLEDDATLDLNETGRWLSERVVGQPRAVDAIVKLLAGVKAGTSRPDKPIASLLFIGPTGVGKTEMSKTLTEFLFGDPQRMVRIDMSEYAEPSSIDRLIGGTFQSEGILTSRVREQPFGVIVLDEFEKAHPRFLDFLLQVLGEGRLTDSAGRLADFRNFVIIITSNLGSDSFGRQRLGFGSSEDPGEVAQEHFMRAVQQFLRPELFNRIDRVVPFLPLDEETLMQIARRELSLLKRREGVQHRDVAVQFTDALAQEFVRLGYDPRYGARPIKRAIDRHLLAPLSTELNEYSADLPLETKFHVTPSGIMITVAARQDKRSRRRETSIREVASDVVHLRRKIYQLRDSPRVVTIRNEVLLLERAEQERQRQIQKTNAPARYPANAQRLSKLARCKDLIDRVDALAPDIVLLEDHVLAAMHMDKELNVEEAAGQVADQQRRFNDMCTDLYASHFAGADQIVLAIYSESSSWLMTLVRGYYRFAKDRGDNVSLYRIFAADPSPANAILLGKPPTNPNPADQRMAARRIEKPEKFLDSNEELELHINVRGFSCVALEISGPQVYPLLCREEGVHVLRDKGQKRELSLLHASRTLMKDYEPPDELGSKLKFRDPGEIARLFDRARKQIEIRYDGFNRIPWPGRKDLSPTIAKIVMDKYWKTIETWLGLSDFQDVPELNLENLG